jgi:hypothetical protein
MKTRDLNFVRLMRRGTISLPFNNWTIGYPALFTVGVCFCFCGVTVVLANSRIPTVFRRVCICGAAIWEYENFKRNGSNTSLQRRTDYQPFVSQTPIYQPYCLIITV